MKALAGPFRCVTTAILAFPSACADAPGDVAAETSSFSVRDSVGIEIVETTGPRWGPGDGLRVDPTPVWEVGSEETVQLYRVLSATRLSDGTAAILNGVTSEILLIAPDGSVAGSFGGQGEGPGELSGPSSVFAFGPDSMLVPELFAARISHFGPDGAYSHSVPARNVLDAAPNGVDGSGGLYFSRTRVISAIPTTTAAAGIPRDREFMGLRLGADGVLDTLIHRPLEPSIFITIGGRATRTLFEPRPWMAGGDASVVFGMTDRWAFEQFDTTGVIQRIARWDRAPEPTTEAIVAADLEGRYGDDATALAAARQGVAELPPAPTVTAWTAFAVDRVGRLWVRPFQVGEVMEAGANDWLYGSMRRGAPTSWVVFGSDGALLGEVEIPADVRPLEIGEDYVLGLRRDDWDIENVAMYRLVGSGDTP